MRLMTFGTTTDQQTRHSWRKSGTGECGSTRLHSRHPRTPRNVRSCTLSRTVGRWHMDNALLLLYSSILYQLPPKPPSQSGGTNAFAAQTFTRLGRQGSSMRTTRRFHSSSTFGTKECMVRTLNPPSGNRWQTRRATRISVDQSTRAR
jgi:hypothetical protein